MNALFKIVFVLTALCINNSAIAKVDSVIAVVNDSVITQQDLDDRLQLTMRHMGTVKLSEDEKKSLTARTLSELVNEELQLQYAESISLKAEASEINMAIDSIEQNNRLPKGAFYKISHGLEKSAKQQVKSEVLWQKIIQRRVRPRVNITNAELDLLIKNLLGQDIVEKEISQIFLSVDESKSGAEVKKRIMNIYNRLEKDPEIFRTIAQTSSEINAAEGGYLGWFGTGELAATIDQALKGVETGGISEPIQSQGGWHILKVHDTRTSQKLETKPVQEMRVVRLSRKLSDDKYKAKIERKKFIKEAKKLKRLSHVEGLILKYSQDEAYMASYDMDWRKKEDLPQGYLNALSKIEKGEFTKIIEDENRITILYHGGERERMPDALRKYRTKVRQRLVASRIDLNARRFMRDLRRKAYVDIRTNFQLQN